MTRQIRQMMAHIQDAHFLLSADHSGNEGLVQPEIAEQVGSLFDSVYDRAKNLVPAAIVYEHRISTKPTLRNIDVLTTEIRARLLEISQEEAYAQHEQVDTALLLEKISPSVMSIAAMSYRLLAGLKPLRKGPQDSRVPMYKAEFTG